MSDTESKYPKGSAANPYTEEEFENMCKEGTWKGGYVEGISGYVSPDVSITGSYSSEMSSDEEYSLSEDSYSEDSWAKEFQDQGNSFDDNGNPNKTNDSNKSGGPVTPGNGSWGGEWSSGTSYATGEGGNQGILPWSFLNDNGKTLVKEASYLSPQVKAKLDMLLSTNSIVSSNDESISGAQWIKGDNIIVLGPKATYGNIWHELVHSIQNNGTHSNMEFQAYMLDAVWAAMSSGGWTISNLTGLNEYEKQKFYKVLLDHCKGDGIVGKPVLDYLNNLDYEKRIQDFINYHKNNASMPKNYTDGYDPNYVWDWERIIREMGFVIK